MKAVVKAKAEPGLWLEEVPVPTVGGDDVLIRVLKASICGTDVHIYNWDAWAQKAIPVPMIIGHEFVGVVDRVGDHVKGFGRGDLVVAEGHITCGHCRNCLAGRRHLCPNTQGVGVNRPGGWAEFVAIPQENCWHADPSIPLDVLSCFDPLGNAVHTALSFDLVGEDVLITGAGPIGALVVLICSAVGASKIFVSEPNANRRKHIENLGVATAVLDPKSVNVIEYIRENTEEGVGVDAAIECSGIEVALNICVEAVRNHGTVVQTGLHVKKALVDPALWALKDITLEATWCYEVTMWPRIIRMISSGKLPVEKIVTGRIEPEAIVEKGFRSLLNPSAQEMKIMVNMS